jgi:hypothetical protein
VSRLLELAVMVGDPRGTERFLGLIRRILKQNGFQLRLMKCGNKTQVNWAYADEGTTMNILAFFTNHHHYWGIPHPGSPDDRLVQTCYECGAEREVKIRLRASPVDEILAPMHGGNLAA